MRLRTKKDNKLSERKANSYGITHKANIMEQMTKTHNKNQKKKFVVKGKQLPKNLMTNTLFAIRLNINLGIIEIGINNKTLRRVFLKLVSPRLITS